MTPATAEEPVRAALDAWLRRHLAPDAPVIVACSGGADSLALAVAAVDCARSRPLFAAAVDHGLQPGSADRAQATVDTLRRLGFAEPTVLTTTVSGPGGMEAAARRARYRVLADHAARVAPNEGPCAVLLAHTADDQAETVLLGLARGSGPRSIAGMREWRAPWGRPLLGVRRVDTERACAAAGLRPWQDPHNTDPSFTRVRIRREVLPLMNDVLGGGVRDALVRTAELMALDLAGLDEIAATVLRRVLLADGSLDARALAEHPAAIVGRVLRGWAATAGTGALTFDQLGRMTRQVMDRSGPRQVRVPGGWDVVRVGDVIRLVPLRPPADPPRDRPADPTAAGT